MKLMAFAVILAALLLVACDDDWEGEGVATAHGHEDSYPYIVMVGKVPVTQIHPEEWRLYVRDRKGVVHNMHVTHEEWTRVHDGDPVCFGVCKR